MIILTAVSIFEVNKIRIHKLDIVNSEYQKSIDNKSNNLDDHNDDKDQLNENNEKEKNNLISTNIQNEKKQKNTSNKMARFILINRWIGIESLILVSNSNNQSFEKFF